MLAQLFCTALHGVWGYLFIVKWDMRVRGVGFAMATTNILMFTLTTLIAYSVPRVREALFMPTRESFEGWGEYFSISIPITIMICAEYWAFELFNVASGYLGV